MIIYLSLLVCIVGALVHLLATKGEIKQMGYAAYWVGLLVFLLKWNGAPLEVIGR